jgi:hypothetical protein
MKQTKETAGRIHLAAEQGRDAAREWLKFLSEA